MKKHQIRKKEIKDINQQIEKYRIEIDIKDKVEFAEIEHKGKKERFVFVNEKPWFYYYDNEMIPVLKLLNDKEGDEEIVMKRVIVDMGAVKFVVGGADIMRPGITEIDTGFVEGDFLVIIDEKNKKNLAVGKALSGSEDMKNTDSGKVVKNIHFVGDWIWEL